MAGLVVAGLPKEMAEVDVKTGRSCLVRFAVIGVLGAASSRDDGGD